MTSVSEADDKQRGGSHYKDVPPELQHWNVVHALGWDYFIGAATKYLWRLGKKDDPVKELDKAIHFLQKKRELILEERTAAAVLDNKKTIARLEAEGKSGEPQIVAEIAARQTGFLAPRPWMSFQEDDGKHF